MNHDPEAVFHQNRHCAGCIKHGTLKDLKRISVHGDKCDGLGPDDELVTLRDTVAKLTDEMNTIIRQKWEVEAERDKLRKSVIPSSNR